MLKSLFAGVSGLQSHQIAMDTESNNIANVNTVGFKYSRANFSDLLAQTQAIATAPQGELGGKNPVQVGLGSTVSSMTRIFSQGSIQNSDKNTDVAIQGDGFFIISPDGGNTYKYTRSGDFKFDAGGNFVDNNGFIVQGWLRDRETGFVDATAPITNIQIPPGLTTPASPTQNVVIKANLNSGPLVDNYSPSYQVESYPAGTVLPILQAIDENGNAIDSGDLGVMFNDSGEAFSLQTGQGIWASFIPTTATATGAVAGDGLPGAAEELDITFTLDDGTTENVTTSGGIGDESAAENAARYVSAINAKTSVTGITAAYDSVLARIILTNNNSNSNASHNIRISAVGNINSGLAVGDSATTAYRYQYDPTGAVTVAAGDKKFTSIADLREALENQARAVGNNDSQISSTAVATTAAVNETHDFEIAGITVSIGNLADGLSAADVATAYAAAINGAAGMPAAGIVATTSGSTLIITNSSGLPVTLDTTALGGFDAGISGLPNNTTTTIPYDGIANENNISIIVNEQGKFELSNPGGSQDGDYDINLSITGMNADSIVGGGITENTRFTRNMEALNATLPTGSTGKAFSQSFNDATHSASIDIFDSLGSKHTVRTQFRKVAVDASTGSTWNMKISVPEPATIDSIVPYNEKTGFVRFNSDGSLSTYNPPNVSFTANNGSAPNQQVAIKLGTSNSFDGMTSFDAQSATSGISQDGFTGGDLVGIRIDQSGTLIGSFSNGRSFGLAQIGMAKFTNNEGLSTEGGNVYIQTANSGDPIIGTAATAGRGFMQSAALEASNVDLSRALTQLIIIQRGYQANGKTITTSDQLLQTLIGLKQ